MRSPRDVDRGEDRAVLRPATGFTLIAKWRTFAFGRGPNLTQQWRFCAVPLSVVVGLRRSQSRLIPSPSTDFFNHIRYCYKTNPPPSGSTMRRQHPSRLQFTAPCLLRPIRERRITDLTESCTQTPSSCLCHSCTRVSRARCPDRGSCRMLGSRYDSVRIRRACMRRSHQYRI